MNAEQIERGMEILHQAGAYCGTCDYQDGMCEDCKRCLRSYLAALEPLFQEARADALRDAAVETSAQAALWHTPTTMTDIPAEWDSHHLTVRGASETALRAMAKTLREMAGDQ